VPWRLLHIINFSQNEQKVVNDKVFSIWHLPLTLSRSHELEQGGGPFQAFSGWNNIEHSRLGSHTFKNHNKGEYLLTILGVHNWNNTKHSINV
jgi:hypothetical protein